MAHFDRIKYIVLHSVQIDICFKAEKMRFQLLWLKKSSFHTIPLVFEEKFFFIWSTSILFKIHFPFAITLPFVSISVRFRVQMIEMLHQNDHFDRYSSSSWKGILKGTQVYGAQRILKYIKYILSNPISTYGNSAVNRSEIRFKLPWLIEHRSVRCQWMEGFLFHKK